MSPHAPASFQFVPDLDEMLLTDLRFFGVGQCSFLVGSPPLTPFPSLVTLTAEPFITDLVVDEHAVATPRWRRPAGEPVRDYLYGRAWAILGCLGLPPGAWARIEVDETGVRVRSLAACSS